MILGREIGCKQWERRVNGHFLLQQRHSRRLSSFGGQSRRKVIDVDESHFIDGRCFEKRSVGVMRVCFPDEEHGRDA